MQVWSLLAILWFVVIVFWLLNHFHRENLKYEQEYKRGERPRW
jgi:heme O synthase-like polyprenyltransferase